MSADDASRIATLEEELRKAREEAARYKEAAYAFLRQIVPDEPPSDEEIDRMLADTNGTPILDIVAEYERAGS